MKLQISIVRSSGELEAQAARLAQASADTLPDLLQEVLGRRYRIYVKYRVTVETPVSKKYPWYCSPHTQSLVARIAKNPSRVRFRICGSFDKYPASPISKSVRQRRPDLGEIELEMRFEGDASDFVRTLEERKLFHQYVKGPLF